MFWNKKYFIKKFIKEKLKIKEKKKIKSKKIKFNNQLLKKKYK
jgi:hypothetical protein